MWIFYFVKNYLRLGQYRVSMYFLCGNTPTHSAGRYIETHRLKLCRNTKSNLVLYFKFPVCHSTIRKMIVPRTILKPFGWLVRSVGLFLLCIYRSSNLRFICIFFAILEVVLVLRVVCIALFLPALLCLCVLPDFLDFWNDVYMSHINVGFLYMKASLMLQLRLCQTLIFFNCWIVMNNSKIIKNSCKIVY